MRTYSIIVVENDEDEQFFIRESITTSGLFKLIGQCFNGEGLFEWLEQHPGTLPDIILSDLNMPGKNGYDIITEIKNTPVYAHIPVVITSTSSTNSTINKCLALGAAGYIEKPDTFVNYDPFFKKLYQMIEDKHLIKE